MAFETSRSIEGSTCSVALSNVFLELDDARTTPARRALVGPTCDAVSRATEEQSRGFHSGGLRQTPLSCGPFRGSQLRAVEEPGASLTFSRDFFVSFFSFLLYYSPQTIILCLCSFCSFLLYLFSLPFSLPIPHAKSGRSCWSNICHSLPEAHCGTPLTEECKSCLCS